VLLLRRERDFSCKISLLLLFFYPFLPPLFFFTRNVVEKKKRRAGRVSSFPLFPRDIFPLSFGFFLNKGLAILRV